MCGRIRGAGIRVKNILRIYTCIHITQQMYVYTFVHTHVHTDAQTQTHTHRHPRPNTTHTRACTHRHTTLHTQTHTDTHTHTYNTLIHTDRQITQHNITHICSTVTHIPSRFLVTDHLNNVINFNRQFISLSGFIIKHHFTHFLPRSTTTTTTTSSCSCTSQCYYNN